MRNQNSENIAQINTTYFTTKLRRIKRRYVNQRVTKLWTEWERDVVTSCPTITVSERIADELRLSGTDTE